MNVNARLAVDALLRYLSKDKASELVTELSRDFASMPGRSGWPLDMFLLAVRDELRRREQAGGEWPVPPENLGR